MTTALILVDFQNEYFPGGAMELATSVETGRQAAKLLDAFRTKKRPIVHVRHLAAQPGATMFVSGSEGAELHDSVSPLPRETVIAKNYPNSFRDTRLLDHLQGLGMRRVAVAGMMTHMCVDATVRGAADHGFDCVVLADATATTDLSWQDVEIPAAQVQGAFLAALAMAYAQVASVDEFMAEL